MYGKIECIGEQYNSEMMVIWNIISLLQTVNDLCTLCKIYTLQSVFLTIYIGTLWPLFKFGLDLVYLIKFYKGIVRLELTPSCLMLNIRIFFIYWSSRSTLWSDIQITLKTPILQSQASNTSSGSPKKKINLWCPHQPRLLFVYIRIF